MLSSVKFLQLKNGRFLHCQIGAKTAMWRYVLLFKVESSDIGHYLKNSQCNVLYRIDGVRSFACHFNYKIKNILHCVIRVILITDG
ncbi:hypothetical protein DJ535_21205 [Citrobacter murliniae]|uniref:Uncharacterized protein n=1 Tax=Citrobacter murliniae TaxID=67829 RepID=A0ABY2PPD9_9ENTR|nr:hypothetical protein DJ535_21205 [Citrobacter murliniae]